MSFEAYISLVGVLVALAGFTIALCQIRKVRKAVDAAKKASQQTAKQIGKISTLVDLTKLSSLSSDVIHLLRAKNVKASALRSLDLREGLAQVRASVVGKKLLRPKAWQEILTGVGIIQETLDGDCIIHQNVDDVVMKKCLLEMSQIHEKINELTANVVDATGGI